MTKNAFQNCLNWWSGATNQIDQDQYCATRDVFEGRLSKVPTHLQRHAGFKPEEIIHAVYGADQEALRLILENLV